MALNPVPSSLMRVRTRYPPWSIVSVKSATSPSKSLTVMPSTLFSSEAMNTSSQSLYWERSPTPMSSPTALRYFSKSLC